MQEESTSDPFARLAAMTRELNCDGIILASSGAHALFLDEQELQYLLSNPPASLVLIRLPTGTPRLVRHGQGSRMLTWFQKLRRPAKVQAGQASRTMAEIAVDRCEERLRW